MRMTLKWCLMVLSMNKILYRSAVALCLFVVFMFVLYFHGVYKVRSAHSLSLVYLSVSDSWTWAGTNIHPFPFRKEVSKSEFMGRGAEYFQSENPEINVYMVTAMFEAVSGSDDQGETIIAIADHLISEGFSVDAPDKYNCNLLQRALMNDDEFSVRFILSRGASYIDETGKACPESARKMLTDKGWLKYITN